MAFSPVAFLSHSGRKRGKTRLSDVPFLQSNVLSGNTEFLNCVSHKLEKNDVIYVSFVSLSSVSFLCVTLPLYLFLSLFYELPILPSSHKSVILVSSPDCQPTILASNLYLEVLFNVSFLLQNLPYLIPHTVE